MLVALINYFFPELKPAERSKFLFLGSIAFMILGTYWLMWLLKQAIFFKIAFPESLGWAPQQGALFQPLAKIWSPFVVLGLVLIYSKLIDLVKKHQLFYIICTFYALLFALIGIALMIKDYSGSLVLGRTFLASMGWIYFFAAESFGSLVIALFWSFTNSITDSPSAQRGFPLITAAAQLGAMGGAGILLLSSAIGAVWPLIILTSVMTAAIPVMIYFFMKYTPSVELLGNPIAHRTEKIKEGFFEGFITGLTLLVRQPYLLGILIISTFGDICIQIVEYLMHSYASLPCNYASETAFCWFQGLFGISTNGFSFVVALMGTRYFIKKMGIRGSLLFYPSVFALTIFILFGLYYVAPLSSFHFLWITFGAMIIFKGLGYAFNNPVKEIMYIPTSKDAKFKSKGWIDMFGGRFAKAGGAQITSMYKHSMTDLIFFGALMSGGLITIWLLAAFFVGKKNEQLVKKNTIIE